MDPKIDWTDQCANCFFYKPSRHGLATGNEGKCRRNPPSTEGSFPDVQASDWCGEYRRKDQDQNLME